MTSELAIRPRALNGQIVPRLLCPNDKDQPPVDFSNGLPGTVYPGFYVRPARPRTALDVLFRLGSGEPDPIVVERMEAVRDTLEAAEFEPIRELFESFGSDEIRAREAIQMIERAISGDINSLPAEQTEKTLRLVSYLADRGDPNELERPLRKALRQEARKLLANRSQRQADLGYAQATAPELDAMSAAVVVLNRLDTPAVRLIRIIAEKTSPEAKHGNLQSLVSCFSPYPEAVRMQRIYAELNIKGFSDKSDLQERFIKSAQALHGIYLSIATGADTNALMTFKEPVSFKERAEDYAAKGLPQLQQILTAGLELAEQWKTKTVSPHYDVVARGLMARDPSLTRQQALLAGLGLS